MPRLSIDKTRQLIVAGTPTCVELLRFFQSKGSWVNLPPEVAGIRHRLKIEDYVQLYDDPRKIGMCFLLAFIDPQDLKSWGQEVDAMSPQDQEKLLEEFATDLQEIGDTLEGMFELHPSEKARLAAQKLFDAMTEDEKRAATRIQQFLWSGFLAGFHNIISVMVHGEALTTLVSKAVAGDDDAFCKAVQIDRQIYTHHPYFRQRIDKAESGGESDFLARVSYRLRTPTARGKIQYPGLWTVLAMLDMLGWLDGSLTAADILDICDEAGLHLHENRIEDSIAMNKRVRAYRKMQKTALLSSH